MSRWLPILVVLLFVGLYTAALTVAQESAPAGPEPGEEHETPDGRTPVAEVGEFRGEVLLKKLGSEQFESLTPEEGEKVLLSVGDSVRTSENASLVITMNDGSLIELGPNSELVIEQTPEGLLAARLISGTADVTFGSDQFAFVCERHLITGADSRVLVKTFERDSVSVFGIEDGAVVENEFGLVTYLGQGQKFEAVYFADRQVFQVTAHEYNELDLKIEVHGKGRLLEPGATVVIDPDLNIVRLGEEPEPEPPVITEVPLELEEPEDEPFENAGDLETIHFVSPSKP